MRKNMKKKIGCLLMGVFLLAAVGCEQESNMGKTNAGTGQTSAEMSSIEEARTDEANFSLRLFQESLDEKENTLVSPFSVFCALAMTANGAKGDTLAQMEQAFGVSVEQCNQLLPEYIKQLEDAEKGQLYLANGIWVNQKDEFEANPDFLAQNKKLYQAELTETVFGDKTAKEINAWVKKQTDGKIQNVLDSVPEEAVMYLVNALSFDAQWEEIYKKNQIEKGVFHQADGTTQKVDFMYSEEDQYLEDADVTGFIKPYAGGRYSFVALLPKEGMEIKDYVYSLTGEQLQMLLSQPQDFCVQAAIPKFQSEDELDMRNILQRMGVKDAFDEKKADFTGLGTCKNGENVYIDRVLHKTFIAVNERGTEAGAATVVEMVKEMALEIPGEVKNVCLDRPFVYLIMDQEQQVPLFMGTVMNL